MSGYPKVMHHPAAAAAKLIPVVTQYPSGKTITDYHSEPARYLPVTVENEDQEARERARGYLPHGEKGPPVAGYSEFPKMLVHPKHVPAVMEEVIPRKGPNSEIIYDKIPGKPEAHPARTANNAAEEEALRAQGYHTPVLSDPAAAEAAGASPYIPGRNVSEWPKMINGVLTPDPALKGRPDPNRYPMWLADGGRDREGNQTGVTVHNPDQEAAHLAKMGKAVPLPQVYAEKSLEQIVATGPTVAEQMEEWERTKRENEELKARLAALEAKQAAPPPAPKPEQREILRAGRHNR